MRLPKSFFKDNRLKALSHSAIFCECDCDKKWAVWMSIRLFIWCNCNAFEHVGWHMNGFHTHSCVIAMCDFIIYLYRSQSHHVNNFTKWHVKKCSPTQKESHRVNEPLIRIELQDRTAPSSNNRNFTLNGAVTRTQRYSIHYLLHFP